MKKVKLIELYTSRLDIKISKYKDQYDLWNIQK